MANIENINLNGIDNPISLPNAKITTFEYTYDAFTMSGGTVHTFAPTNSLPDNYIKLGIKYFQATNAQNCAFDAIYDSGALVLRNNASSAETPTPKIGIVCLVK